MVPELKLPPKQIIFVALLTAVLAGGAFVGIASAWVFPVPFGLVLMCPIQLMVHVIALSIVVEHEQFQENPELRHQLRDQLRIMNVQASLCVVCPCFGEVYNALPPEQQSVFILVLPVIKAIMQYIGANTARNVVENMPGITLLSVKVFIALYSVKRLERRIQHDVRGHSLV